MSRVRIHCYGCTQTVLVEEDAMSAGLQRAGWALAHGETFCPSCAAERKLEVVSDHPSDGEPDPDAAPVFGADASPSIDADATLEPFSSVLVSEPRIGRAMRLLSASASVLREDPQLLVFPAVAMALNLALGAFWFVLSLSSVGTARASRSTILVASLIVAYPLTFVSLFCGVALAAVLGGRLNGQQLTASDGWKAARERIGIIAAWTLLTCTVGAVLRLIEQYVPLGARIVVAIVDMSWSLATMFAVPILAYENLGPRETFRRSAHIFRQRWGTQIGGTVGIGVAASILYAPFVVLLMVGLSRPGATGVLLAVLGGVGLFAAIAVQAALDQIFRVFVYRNAIGLDATSGPFEQSDLQSPFARKRKRY